VAGFSFQSKEAIANQINDVKGSPKIKKKIFETVGAFSEAWQHFFEISISTKREEVRRHLP
jgi:hypothetical protein